MLGSVPLSARDGTDRRERQQRTRWCYPKAQELEVPQQAGSEEVCMKARV